MVKRRIKLTREVLKYIRNRSIPIFTYHNVYDSENECIRFAGCIEYNDISYSRGEEVFNTDNQGYDFNIKRIYLNDFQDNPREAIDQARSFYRDRMKYDAFTLEILVMNSEDTTDV
jgi:hypothetical protein